MNQPTHKFHSLKIAKKEELTKNVFYLKFAIPKDLQHDYTYKAGQYVTLKWRINGVEIMKDYSMVSAPFEGELDFAIKMYGGDSSSQFLFENYQVDDVIEVSLPKGRFTLVTKPSEFRTVVGFAAGIGITPIFSHFKELLHSEPRTRLFLFYGSKNSEEVVFKKELDELVSLHPQRLEVHYFYSQEKLGNAFLEGRLDEKKLNLIINQILHLDDTDEESTIWDSVDEVLICGKGEMIKALANACYDNGIPKRNIHFELFEAFNEDIFPVKQDFPLVKDISIEFQSDGVEYKTSLVNNQHKILQQLLEQKFPVPYSCKSGICGACICQLEKGKVELLENEYLTEKEEKDGKILACMSFALSSELQLNFDLV